MSRALLAVLIVGCVLSCASRPAFASLPQRDIEKLCAPIALYPDTLVANILAASTYPEEVTQAAAFVRQSGPVPVSQVDARLTGQEWDPAVKALVSFPDILSLLINNAPWASELGNTFLGQQMDVFRAIQTLRAAAEMSGNLVSNPQYNVVDANGNVILQPAAPGAIAVPFYDPAILYYWAPHPWYVSYGSPVGVDDTLWSGILDWATSNLFFGQGYNNYYGGGGQNVPVIQNNIHNGVGAWSCNHLHRQGMAAVPTQQVVSRASITRAPLAGATFPVHNLTGQPLASTTPLSQRFQARPALQPTMGSRGFAPSQPSFGSQNFAPRQPSFGSQNFAPRQQTFSPSMRRPFTAPSNALRQPSYLPGARTPLRQPSYIPGARSAFRQPSYIPGARTSFRQPFSSSRFPLNSAARSFSRNGGALRTAHSLFSHSGHTASALGKVAHTAARHSGGFLKAAGSLLKGLTHLHR